MRRRCAAVPAGQRASSLRIGCAVRLTLPSWQAGWLTLAQLIASRPSATPGASACKIGPSAARYRQQAGTVGNGANVRSVERSGIYAGAMAWLAQQNG